jgi:hypothetical protein
MTSKHWQSHIRKLFDPKFIHALPLSHGTYSSLIKKIEICRGVAAALDVAPGLQLFEYESVLQDRCGFHVVPEFLPWNCNYFIEIVTGRSNCAHSYLNIYKLQQAKPTHTFDLFEPIESDIPHVSIQATAFNSNLQYFALAYEVFFSENNFKHAVRVYAFRENDSIVDLIDERESSVSSHEVTSVAISDQGNVWFARGTSNEERSFGSFCIGNKNISSIHNLEGGMSYLGFVYYKGKALAVSLISQGNETSFRIDDVENGTIFGSFSSDAILKGNTLQRISYEVKGELLIADVLFTKISGPAVRLKHFVFNLEHKTEHKVVSSSLLFSGQYVLNEYNHTLRNLTDDEKNSISIETRSCTQITWCTNSDVLVGKCQDFISAYSLSRGCQRPKPKIGVLYCDSIPKTASAVNMQLFELPFRESLFDVQAVKSNEGYLLIVANYGKRTVVIKFRIRK